MRQSLVKEIRRSAKHLFGDRPFTEYTTKGKTTVLTDHCIKRIIKDTKIQMRKYNESARGKRL